MESEQVTTTKIHINVGTASARRRQEHADRRHHPGDGRRHGGKSLAFADIDNCQEEGERGITINASHVEYESDPPLPHIDRPGHADFTKNTIIGASQMDLAISARRRLAGAQKQIIEHVPARQVGVRNLVVFINTVGHRRS
ncbi:MAG: hypothetical protein IPK74_28975 [Deltaproteobacteria bacterium]|nr:hypothetical protein [Deltaproteobacteria bacterium]